MGQCGYVITTDAERAGRCTNDFFLMYVEKEFISIRRGVKIRRVSGSFMVSIYLLRSNVSFKLFSLGLSLVSNYDHNFDWLVFVW